jgi:hypothetical protein
MYLADRVDRRQIHHVETPPGHSRQRLGRRRERPVDRVTVVVPAARGSGEELVPGTEPGQRPVHPHAVLLTAREYFAQRVLIEQVGHLGRQRRADTGERVARFAQPCCRLSQWIAMLTRHPGGCALQQPRTDQQIVGQFRLALPGVEFGGHPAPPRGDRIAPAVHPERPQPDAVGHELAVEHIRGSTRHHRHLLGLHPQRRVHHILDRHRFGGLDTTDRIFGQARIRSAVVPHHQGGRHGVVALSPHRGLHRHHLAHDGLGRIPTARNDGLDIVNSDTTGHPTHSLHWRGDRPRRLVSSTTPSRPARFRVLCGWGRTRRRG